MASKLDFLKECMSGFNSIPIDQFNLTWCVICVNKECGRAKAGQLFNTRAETWKEKLFTEVKRADEKDPNYNHIFSKPFLLVNADPLTIQSIPSFPQPPPEAEESKPTPIQPVNFKVEEQPVEIKEEILETTPEPEPVVPESVPTISPTAPAVNSNSAVPFNTPFNAPVMIKQKATPNDTVIESGGTFTFDDE